MCARDLLEAELQSLAARGIVPASRIAELEGSLCRRGVAFDVALFLEVFREHWSAIDGNSMITWGDLYQLEISSDRLLAALSLRDRSDASALDASLQRQRAFSLLIHARERARRAPHAARLNRATARARAFSSLAAPGTGRAVPPLDVEADEEGFGGAALERERARGQRDLGEHTRRAPARGLPLSRRGGANLPRLGPGPVSEPVSAPKGARTSC